MNKWILIILIVPLLLSCSDDDSRGGGNSNGAQVTVHFPLSVAGMKSVGDTAAATRGAVTRSISPSTVQESAINDLWVLQFQNGTLVSKTYFSSIDDPTAFDVKLTSGTSNIYFIANVGSNPFSAYTVNSTTEDTFKSATQSVTSETAALENNTYIPMEASLTSVNVSARGYMSQPVTLARILARVDIKFTQPSNLMIRSIRVCNMPNVMSYCVPIMNYITGYYPDPLSVNTFGYSDVSPISSGSQCSYTFYLPENYRGTGTNTGMSDTQKGDKSDATYIELVGYSTGATTAGQGFVYHIYPGNDNNNYNIVRNVYYTYNLSIAGYSTTDARVKTYPRANCYMIAPGDSVYIPLIRANDSDLGTQIPNLTADNYSVGVQWQDLDGEYVPIAVSQTANDRACGVFKVKSTSNGTGNAVVYVKNGDNILWSWHIWVTNYNPNTENTVLRTGGILGDITFMNYNLGSSITTPGQAGKGLYYQWGRKDPFPQAYFIYSNYRAELYGSVSFTDANVQVARNLLNAVRNPSTFYGTTDWLTNDVTYQNNTLWNATKTVYDPCPAGWKVPSDAQFWNQQFSALGLMYNANDYGYINSNNFFFAMAGNQFPGSGLANVGGTTLYATSVAASDGTCNALSFTTNSMSMTTANRSVGYLVRCVKE